MRKNLETIASKLSESDLQEIIRLKKKESKKSMALHKKRERLAVRLAKIDEQLGQLTGEVPAGKRSVPKRRGRKPGRKPAAGKAKTLLKKVGRRRGRRVNLTAAVRGIFEQASNPLKAKEVVAALPAAGIKVKDVASMRKRISNILATQKKYFAQVERGLYRFRD